MVRSGAASRLGDILHQGHEAAADLLPVVALLDQMACLALFMQQVVEPQRAGHPDSRGRCSR